MRNIVCCIAKNESKYIEEFVEYHLELGFEQVIIGDNNDVDGERYEEQLSDYIENDEVVIYDLRGKTAQQYPFYNEIIKNYDFDWCAFIDCDEFLTFGKESKFDNIADFLNSNPNIHCYTPNWMVYGDNERVFAGEGDVVDRFKSPKPLDFKFHYPFPENRHVKTILNKKADTSKFVNQPHCTDFKEQYSPSGKLLNGPTPFNEEPEYNVLYIRHYYTKSLEEWVNKKMKNKYADRQPSDTHAYYPLDDYFIYNRLTDAKIKYLKQHGIEYKKKL